jgi:RimJ/RimL family protein N-acetyltransferase
LNPDGHLGYMLDPSAWGKGYATEALTAYLTTLFKYIPELEQVEAAAYEDNLGSRRVLEKCGFIACREARWYQNNSEDDLDGSREEKIRDLKRMLQEIGLQSRGVDESKAKGRILLYRYTKQKP